MRSDRGFTVALTFGSFAGFCAFRDGRALRVNAGWIGLTLALFDLDIYLDNVMEMLERCDPEKENSHG